MSVNCLECGVPHGRDPHAQYCFNCRRTTMKDACEAIHRHWTEHHPEAAKEYPTPTSIFEYSATGELFMVGEWLDEAVAHEAELPRVSRGAADAMNERLG